MVKLDKKFFGKFTLLLACILILSGCSKNQKTDEINSGNGTEKGGAEVLVTPEDDTDPEEDTSSEETTSDEEKTDSQTEADPQAGTGESSAATEDWVPYVLDVEVYKAAYEDLRKAYGNDANAYVEHYITKGVYEKHRRIGVKFDPIAYSEAYADVKAAFGDDIMAIIDHYINYGIAENRTEGTSGVYADIAKRTAAEQSLASASKEDSGTSVSGSSTSASDNSTSTSGSGTQAPDNSTSVPDDEPSSPVVPPEEDPTPIEADFFVDAKGSADGTGTQENPFNTIQKAVEAVRTVNDNMTEDIVVYIMDGEYYLEEPIALTEEDGGNNGHQVIYRAESTAGVRIYGANKLTGWVEHENGIWKVPVEEPLYTLYEGETRVTQARYPNKVEEEEFVTADGPYLLTTDTDTANTETIQYNTTDLAGISFEDIEDANIVIYAWNTCDWAKFNNQILSVDKEKGIITPALTKTSIPYGLNCRYYIEGMYELLDVAGEYHYDSSEKMLYYKPLQGGNPNTEIDVYAPTITELFTVTDASNITFEGLSFEKTNFVRTMMIWYNHDYTLKGAVTLKNTSNIAFEECRFKNTGLSGIYITGRSSDNSVENCLFENIGISGVILKNDMPTDSSRMKDNIIKNCLMHDLGENALDCAGVNIWATQGTIVENCEFYNSARYAVSIRGNASESHYGQTYGPDGYNNQNHSGLSKDNVVRNCLFYKTNQDSGDTGSIHTAGLSYPEETGNTNYFENIFIDSVEATESMNDLAPNGYFGDYFSNHQSFKNIKVTNNVGAVNVNATEDTLNFNQYRYNKTDAETGIYENVSWGLDFDDTKFDYSNIGLTKEFPEELVVDKEVLTQAVILQLGTNRAYVYGKDEVLEAEAVVVSGQTYVPVSVVEQTGTNRTQVSGKTETVNGTEMVALSVFEELLNQHTAVYDGLIIISKADNLLDAERDSMTIRRLGNELFEDYDAESFQYDVIQSSYQDYEVIGTGLQDGESYMLRANGSKNAAMIAISKENGKARLIVRRSNYSIPDYVDLSASAQEVRFVKENGKIAVFVDNTEVYKEDNFFEDAVYVGTYTEKGTNTLTIRETGLSIAPAEPTGLQLNFASAEVAIGDSIRYHVYIKDSDGNSYELTDEAITVTSSDEAVMKADNGYLTGLATGSVTITAKATVNGEELTAAGEIAAVEESTILLKESFDGESLPESIWTLKNVTDDSYIKINEDHWLEVYANSGKAVSISRGFDGYSGKIAVEFDFKADFSGTEQSGAALAYLLGDNNKYSISTFAYEGSFGYFDNNVKDVVRIGSCQSGETYHIKLIADTATQSYDFYVNGEKLVENVAFRFAGTSINGIFMGSTGDALDTKLYWDNLVVTKEGGDSESEVPSTPTEEPLPTDGYVAFFSDSFDGDVLSASWSVNNKDEAADITINEEQQLQIAHSRTKVQTQVYTSFGTQSGKIMFEFDYMLKLNESSQMDATPLMIYGKDADGKSVVCIQLKANNVFGHYYNDANHTTPKVVEDGVTYAVKVVADTDTDTYDLYIDGNRISTGIPFRNAGESLTQARFVHNYKKADDKSPTAYYDNVVISKREEAVSDLLSSISVTPDATSCDVNEQISLSVKGMTEAGNEVTVFDSITYESSDSSILAVDENGVVTGVAGGSATITVTATHGGVSKSADVELTVVVYEQSGTVSIESEDTLFNDGSSLGTTQLKVVYTSTDNGTLTEVPFDVTKAVSNNTEVLTVEVKDGVATATAVPGATGTAEVSLTVMGENQETLVVEKEIVVAEGILWECFDAEVLPSGWLKKEVTGITYTTDFATGADNRSLSIKDEDSITGSPFVYYNKFSADKNFAVEYDYKIEVEEDGVYMPAAAHMFLQKGTTAAVCLKTKDENLYGLKANGAIGTDSLGTVKAGQWTHVKIDADLVNHTYTVSVTTEDGAIKKTENIAFRNEVDSINRINFYTDKEVINATHYFDNLKIYYN